MARGVERRDKAMVVRSCPDACVGFKTEAPRFPSLQHERILFCYVQQDYRTGPEAIGFEPTEIQMVVLWQMERLVYGEK